MLDDGDESHFSSFLDSLNSYEEIAKYFSLFDLLKRIKMGGPLSALFRPFKNEKMVEPLSF